jgi:hypothetical protein
MTITINHHSEDIKDLVSALSKAQSVMKPAVFNKVNPHFKSRYADFASCMDACRTPLSSNGLAVIQSCETVDGKLMLVTMLAHISGQWMKSEFPLIPSKMDSQAIGSAMTYAKRYSLCGMIGIVADEDGDDDGEAAVGRGKVDAKSAEKNLKKLLEMFDKQDKELVMEYVKVVMNHFSYSEQETVSKFLEDKDLESKFNTWKGKRKAA